MIDRVESTSQLDVAPGDIVEIYRSINENLMSAETYPTQKSEATIIGVRNNSGVHVFVHYYLYNDNAGLLYEENDSIDTSNYVTYRDAALESVESMGFLLENLNYRKLSEADQMNLIQSLPTFGGVGKHVGEYGSVDEAQEDSADESVFLLDDTVHELSDDSAEDSTSNIQENSGSNVSLKLAEADWKLFFRFVASF